MIMGESGKKLICFGFTLIVAITAYAQEPPMRPGNLPKPPPLPREMLERAPAQPPPDLPDPAELIAQLKQLEELLSLSPDKLKSLRQTLEFIEKMSLEEREAMRIRLSQITQMTSSLRREIDGLGVHVHPKDKANLSQYWLAATEEERQQVRDGLNELAPDEKSQLLAGKIAAFVQHRDEVFQRMKDSLESKREALKAPKE